MKKWEKENCNNIWSSTIVIILWDYSKKIKMGKDIRISRQKGGKRMKVMKRKRERNKKKGKRQTERAYAKSLKIE